MFCRCCWFELLYVLQVLIACTIIDLCLFVAAAPQKGILSLDSLVEFVAIADLHGDSACHRHALFCLYQDKKSTSKTQKHSDKGSHSTADGRDVFLKNKNSRVRSVPLGGKKKCEQRQNRKTFRGCVAYRDTKRRSKTSTHGHPETILKYFLYEHPAAVCSLSGFEIRAQLAQVGYVDIERRISTP